MESGKRVKYYRLNTEDVAFARMVLDYRQQQEREPKRQQEQELQAAWMQTMYGIHASSTLPLLAEVTWELWLAHEESC
ncbi:hypothetical protein [Nostoc sp.]|uniref:hypothetical protein n=1 Tax=Nostoc sp. TaxID=1180 RepID=UPI002FF92584